MSLAAVAAETVPYTLAGKYANTALLSLHPSRHVGIVIVRHLSCVWLIFVLQHGFGGWELLREGTHQANSMTINWKSRHRRRRVAEGLG